jgi:hypothetical protein
MDYELSNSYNKYKTYYNIGILCVLMYCVYNGFLQNILFNIYFLIYLINKTIIALKNGNIGHINNLCKYWISYGCYNIVRNILNIIFKFLPFSMLFNLIEMLIFMWIINGNTIIEHLYDNWIIIYYDINIEHINKIFENIHNGYNNFLGIIGFYFKKKFGNISKLISNIVNIFW